MAALFFFPCFSFVVYVVVPALGQIRFCALILYFVKKWDFFTFSEKYSLFLANNTVFKINYTLILS